jgi:hypothetical protein
MKQGLLLIGLTVAITLVIVFGWRASPDALGVVIGIGLGVIATVPATVLVIFMLTRNRVRLEPPPPSVTSPPVVIVNPPERAALPPPAPPPYLPYPTESISRRWTIIGDGETD